MKKMCGNDVKIPLPLRSLPIKSSDISSRKSKLDIFKGFYEDITSNPRTRKIFLFLLLNTFFMSTEVIFGYLSNSLGLIGDGLHMLLDSSSIFLSLVASTISKWDATSKFSYGFSSIP